MGKETLQKEKDSLSEKLASETAAKVNLQANLKRVFMRGVCQLNFEAMNLLGVPPNTNASGAAGASTSSQQLLDAAAGDASGPGVISDPDLSGLMASGGAGTGGFGTTSMVLLLAVIITSSRSLY